jgi:hypothetical protein
MRRPEKRHVNRVACNAVQVSLSIACVCAQSRLLAAHTGPVCRLANCRNPAIRDGATHELTEYCSLDHMQLVVVLRVLVVRALVLNVAFWVSREDARRGARLCPACNKCPRRINGKYCGISCEKYDRERLQQPHQQQQHYPRPPAGVRPHLSTPSPRNVNWNNPGESSSFTPDNHQLSPVGGTRSLGFMRNSTID